jgi:S-adenosylmethionine hydrolase
MLTRPLITLTTDFGEKDPFVGIMKGVILGINPDVNIIDISHNITPQNIIEASRVISMSYRYFPHNTIHVAVIDPGVGGLRKPLLIATENYYFIGPDNGIFTHVLQQEQPGSFHVIHMNASHYFLPQKGPTFHGRDIFAPAAAWLSKGIDDLKLGDTIKDYVMLPSSGVNTVDNAAITGKVTHIDNFGNAITNITMQNLESLSRKTAAKGLEVYYKEKKLAIVSFYEEQSGSDLAAVMNSFDFLELFIYRGNASSVFGILPGDKVRVTAD